MEGQSGESGPRDPLPLERAMLTRQACIERARAEGSSAAGVRGAIRFLMSRISTRREEPLERRGSRTWETRQDWTNQRRNIRMGVRAEGRAAGAWSIDDAREEIAREEREWITSGLAGLVRAYKSAGFRATTGPGGHSWDIRLGEPGADSRAEKTWDRPDSYRYPALTTSHTLTVRRDWPQAVEARGLATVDGLVTLDARSLTAPASLPGAEAWQAVWVEQGRGTSLRTVRGVIVRWDGETAHGKTPSACVATLRRRAFATRETARQALSGRAAEIREWIARHGIGTYPVEVSPSDSDRAGNCDAGTRDWIARHAGGRQSLTVREILGIVARTGDRVRFALAACTAAIRAARVEAA